MTAIRTESELLGVAKALVGESPGVTRREARLLDKAAKVDRHVIRSVLELVKAGGDPLGAAFCILRSSAERRKLGATYTPPAIVAAMTEWACSRRNIPARIVDPGSGSGRFLIAAAKHYRDAELVAVEIDPLASLMLRANARVLGFESRLTVKLFDYRLVSLPKISGQTLFIGNPPYIRHHNLSENAKRWFATTAAAYGFKASKLAGLHVHFFLKTRTLAQPGDFGSYITAAEWLDVNYGAALRDMLANGLGGTSVHLLSAETLPFADAMSTGAITCFEAGARKRSLAMRRVSSLADLTPLSAGRQVSWSKLNAAPKWSLLINSEPVKSLRRGKNNIEVGELFRVHRGQVTGANKVWIAGLHTPPLPARFLFPCVTKAKELMAAGTRLNDESILRKVIDLPTDLSGLSTAERLQVEDFLAWGRCTRCR